MRRSSQLRQGEEGSSRVEMLLAVAHSEIRLSAFEELTEVG